MARHALLVGVGEFEDARLRRLNAPNADVHALGAVLQDQSRGGFSTVKVELSGNYLQMRNSIAEFFLGSAAEDLLFFYYSGHGILSRRNRLFLASSSSNLDIPQSASISAVEVRDWISDSRAQQQVIVLDCCHSGAFVEGAKSGSAQAITHETFEVDGTGQYIMTASDALQFAWDGDELRDGVGVSERLSKFTSWLVEGLDGRAAPEDEHIRMDALYAYVAQRARSTVAHSTPQRFVYGGIGNPPLSKNPNAGLALIDPAVREALDSGDWTHRLGAVSFLEQLAKGERITRIGARVLITHRLHLERDYVVRQALERALEQCPADSNPPEQAITFSGSQSKSDTNNILSKASLASPAKLTKNAIVCARRVLAEVPLPQGHRLLAIYHDTSERLRSAVITRAPRRLGAGVVLAILGAALLFGLASFLVGEQPIATVMRSAGLTATWQKEFFKEPALGAYYLVSAQTFDDASIVTQLSTDHRIGIEASKCRVKDGGWRILFGGGLDADSAKIAINLLSSKGISAMARIYQEPHSYSSVNTKDSAKYMECW